MGSAFATSSAACAFSSRGIASAGFPQPVERDPANLHRLQIGGILREGAGKRGVGFGQMVVLVLDESSKPLDTGRFRLQARQYIQFAVRVVEFALAHKSAHIGD